MLAVSIPNLVTSAALVETATKCLAMAFSSPPSALSIQSRAVWALVIVSSVVKVFEETIKRVSAWVEVADGFGKIGAVNIGNEAKRHRAVAVMFAAPHRPSPDRGRSRRCQY